MRIFRTAAIAVVALGGVFLLSPSAAQAAPGAACNRVHQQSGPSHGLVNVLNGTQLNAPINLGLLDLSGLALGLLGSPTATGGDRTALCGN
jgi:hypothetical protein